LEDKVLDKLGGVKSFRVDFRLVASTNRDLRQMIGRGEFREDLYYRLNTMTVQIPALAQRIGDIPVLVDHFLAHLEKPEVKLSQEALKVLRDYPWPGNLRELRNVIERAVSVAEGKVIRAEHLPPEVLRLSCDIGELSGSSDGLLAEELARWERSLLNRAIGLNQGNMSKASKMLGISRSTLYEKCQKYGLRHIPG
jgi:two-component system response regulator HydG